MKKLLLVAASAAFVMGTMSLAPMSAQAAAWGKCKACHNFTHKKKVGPGLAGVIGRVAGKVKGVKSKSLKSATWTWDDDKLRLWMCNSKKAIKTLTGDDHAKTKMPPQKICDPAKQDEVLEKLHSIS
ncbi:cytochrome C [Mariprofundus ferrooxydans]|nr:cytochrome C [Mariprofundus ferrooxydans]